VLYLAYSMSTMCVVIAQTLLDIHTFINLVSKMTSNLILRHLGIISENEDSERVDECDC
jgi:hypothetical protein